MTRRWYASAGAALLVALSAVDLRYGIFVTPDALSGMAATLAALGAVMITRNASRRRYLWTGAAIGLAAAAKYNAATVADRHSSSPTCSPTATPSPSAVSSSTRLRQRPRSSPS